MAGNLACAASHEQGALRTTVYPFGRDPNDSLDLNTSFAPQDPGRAALREQKDAPPKKPEFSCRPILFMIRSHPIESVSAAA